MRAHARQGERRVAYYQHIFLAIEVSQSCIQVRANRLNVRPGLDASFAQQVETLSVLRVLFQAGRLERLVPCKSKTNPEEARLGGPGFI